MPRNQLREHKPPNIIRHDPKTKPTKNTDSANRLA